MSDYQHGWFCPSCGEENGEKEQICHACGASLNASAELVTAIGEADTATDDTPEWYRAIHKPTVFSTLTAMISFFLIILAFCPFVNVKTTHGQAYYEASFSPVEIVQYASKAFTSYSTDAELLASEEYKEFKAAYDRAAKITPSKNISKNNKELLEAYAKSAIKLDLVSSESHLKGNLIFAFFATLAYIAAAFAALVLSVAALFKNGAGKLGSIAASILGFITLFSPPYLLILSQASKFSNGAGVKGFGNGGVAMAWGLVATLLIFLLILFFIGAKFYAKITGFVGFSASHTDKIRIASALLLIAASLSVFLPFMSVSCAAPNTNGKVSKATKYISSVDICEFSEADAEYYTQEGLSNSSDFKKAAEDVAKKRANISAGNTLLHSVIYFLGNLSILYIFTTLFAILFMVLALTLVKKIITSQLRDIPIKNRDKHLGFTIASAAAYLIFSVVLAVIANATLSDSLSSYILFGIGIGPVFAFILTLAVLFALRLRPHKEEGDNFDNPDVSKAPYVIS